MKGLAVTFLFACVNGPRPHLVAGTLKGCEIVKVGLAYLRPTRLVLCNQHRLPPLPCSATAPNLGYLQYETYSCLCYASAVGQWQLHDTFSPLQDPGLRMKRKAIVGPHNGFYSIYSGGGYVVST